jgi:hypothetical protein
MVGRNTLFTPGIWHLNAGIYKNFQVTERVNLQFRGEFFNIFNHANMYIDTSTIDIEGGGPVATKRGCGLTVSPPCADNRDIQLALKLTF